jgi:hypothetical protein
MQTSLDYHYRNGGHLLEIRDVFQKPAFHFYFDGQRMDAFESLHAAFFALQASANWPDDGFVPPLGKSNWREGKAS